MTATIIRQLTHEVQGLQAEVHDQRVMVHKLSQSNGTLNVVIRKLNRAIQADDIETAKVILEKFYSGDGVRTGGTRG